MLALNVLEDFGELDFGDLKGMTYDEIQNREPEVFQSWMTSPTETQFPNGESFRRMSARVVKAFDSLLSRHTGESIAIVAHAGVIRILLGKALAIPDNEIFRLAQHYGAINRIRYSDHGPIVELING